MARAMLDCVQITQPRTTAEQVIYGSVREIAERLHITMPEVWVYESPDPNAFATGPSKNNAMVAVSTGLLANLREDEVKAVLAHEMGHVFNGDMFSTTVLAGLMNTFVHYISNFVYQMVAQPQGGDREEGQSGSQNLGFVVYMKESMIKALQAIDRWVNRAQFEYSTQDALATMKISGNTSGFLHLLATHPPIEERVAALERL